MSQFGLDVSIIGAVRSGWGGPPVSAGYDPALIEGAKVLRFTLDLHNSGLNNLTLTPVRESNT